MTQNLTTKELVFVYTLVPMMFATFHNPRMRGHNFSWDNFGSMMKDTAIAQYPIACKRNPSANTCAVVGHHAKELAELLVRVMKKE